MDELNEETRLRQRVESLEQENARLAKMLTEQSSGGRGAAASALRRHRIEDLERNLAEMSTAFATERERADDCDRVLKDVLASPSWKLTAPLRAFKRKLRGGGA